MCAETYYKNLEREALGISRGIEKFHHYNFTHKVSIIADHKPLVAIFIKSCKPVTQASKNKAADTSVQYKNII